MRDLAFSDPRVVGPYRTRAVLGEGGMGRVLLACDSQGGLVAVKLVRGAFAAADDSFRRRLHREAVAARRVHSTGTARVIDADTGAGVPWLAYEFHRGPTLQRALSAAGALPEETVLRLGSGLAGALRDIHAADVIHRDLSAANVLLTDGGPVVIDFGVARQALSGQGASEQTELVTVTRTGMVIGNPGFMSPEQAMGLSELTPASDVFSLGILLAMAATGRNPFQGPTGEQTRLNVMTVDPDLDALPPRLRTVVEPCLARDPDRRPDAEGVLAAIGAPPGEEHAWPEPVRALAEQQSAELARYTEVEPTTILPGPRDLDPTRIFAPAEANSPDPGPSPQPSRRRRSGPVVLAVTAAAVAVVLAVLGVQGVLFGGGDTDDTDTAEGSAAEPEHAFVGATQGDCFRNAGDMQAMDFAAAECDTDVFEVLRAFDNTTDRSVCDSVADVEWRYSVPDPDVTVCLVYRHGDGTAYNADRGDCVDGGTAGAGWSLEECRSGGLVVLGRIEGESAPADCERVPRNEEDHYFTVEGSPELNVRLCMGTN